MPEETTRTGLAISALRGVATNPVVAGPMARIEQHPQWTALARLPLKLAVAVPLPAFRVRELLSLSVGQTIQSTWTSSEDVPIEVGGVQMAWSEFEVVNQRLAIRLTRVA